MLTERRSAGSAASAFSASASASRSMARPSEPASIAGRKAPAASSWPSGSRSRASISKKAGMRGIARPHHRLEVELDAALRQGLRHAEAQARVRLEPAGRDQGFGGGGGFEELEGVERERTVPWGEGPCRGGLRTRFT